MPSPTARSLKYLRDNGYTAQVVEKFNSFTKQRNDLFKCIDIVAIKPGEILGVQSTSGSNHSARVVKSCGIPELHTWFQAGGKFVVHSWAKKGPRGKQKTWAPRAKFLTEDVLDPSPTG